jgi:hypothetical protein
VDRRPLRREGRPIRRLHRGWRADPPYLRSGYTGKFIAKERRVVGGGGIVDDRAELKQLVTTTDDPVSAITKKPLGNIADLLL